MLRLLALLVMAAPVTMLELDVATTNSLVPLTLAPEGHAADEEARPPVLGARAQLVSSHARPCQRAERPRCGMSTRC